MDDLISRLAAIDAVIPAIVDGADAEMVEGLLYLVPSAQPEILHCKDCKYYAYGECHYSIGRKVGRRPHDFCSRAERR